MSIRIAAQSELGDEYGNNSEDEEEDIKHCVVFKCIGSTRDPKYQEILKSVAQKRNSGETVDVKLKCEPNNPFDAKAIAFFCNINEKWYRIGYVVREALDAVHDALSNDKIESTTFNWVKYVVHWSKSGPGWYAGINITKIGRWPEAVVRCSSS